MMAQANVAPVIIKRKKSGGGDGHHGGAWKVAYADFVTAMMAFFLLMWLLNATTDKQRKGLADYFSPSIPMHSVSSGSDGPFGGDSVFSQDNLLSDGTGAPAANSSDSQEQAGAQGLEAQAQHEAENETFKDIEEALNGKGGESLVTDEALKHIVTRVTDEGLIIELFDIDGTPLFEPGTDRPSDLLRDLLKMIARVTA
ncbi:MAG: flagellar motor protein MotB, partial [Pseudomonadota bacterium]|nr:flagellar motor protein MotB [Pseudomonadota bacterium]